ncbi:L-aspartate oxidase [bacterium]|nr:L-aspartate oxidase [bacterium]
MCASGATKTFSPDRRSFSVTRHRDIVIVGAGLAGLFLALKLSPRPCTVLTPAPLGELAASAWAQGGLAAALDPADSAELHAADTIAAGAGLVDPVVAQMIAEDGPARVRDLLELGVPFDRTAEGALALSLEAAHSRARVARVSGDLAGKAIMQALCYAVQTSAGIEVLEGVRAIALLQDPEGRVTGVRARRSDGASFDLPASETVLSAGGSGGLYAITTNPHTALGDAVAMAYQAGAMIADPEFTQFHPTAIDVGRDPAPLATEALRGEGARLIDRSGRAFMLDYHPMGELAPRDEVARAIHAERKAGRGALLDAREAVGRHFPVRFPTVFAACMSAQIDPREQPIPVAPAMHYHMGGVASDLWGRSTLEGLSVCGESASTGAHGANRLASNSLLEAVVFAERIARRLESAEGTRSSGPGLSHELGDLADPDLKGLRQVMHRDVGVSRDAQTLSAALSWIDAASARAPLARPLIAARLISAAALSRRESRGGHFRSDHPSAATPAQRTLIHKGGDGVPVIHLSSPSPEGAQA